MGLFDKIKNMMGAPEDDEYEYQDEIQTEKRPVLDEDVFSSTKREPQPAYSTEKKGKFVSMPTAGQLQVVLVKPERFDDAPGIADHLNSKHTVVLNLENTNRDIARRLIDFLSGVAYANNGQIKRVANSTFIITPFNVDVTGDLILDELESNNMYF